jgi:hypothetical protein
MSRIDDLIEQARSIQEDLQTEFDKKREGAQAALAEERLRFSKSVAALQRKPPVGSLRYIAGTSFLNLLAFPVIWLMLIPMALLDLLLGLYQLVCFSVYRIPRVSRSEYIVLDRGDLPYLNAVEKLNCAYCGYANGLASYFREISARTEQYWCPIKHARRIVAMHERYPTFFEHGDAESYRLGLERLRDQARTEPDQ